MANDGMARPTLATLTATEPLRRLRPSSSPAGTAISAGDEQRGEGQGDVLEQAVGDAVGALPVERVVEPHEHVVEEVHRAAPRRRAHGVSARWADTMVRSSATASATVSTAPTSSGVLKKRLSPVKISWPSPPWSEPR